MYALTLLRPASAKRVAGEAAKSQQASGRRSTSRVAYARSNLTSTSSVNSVPVPLVARVAQRSRNVTRSRLERSSQPRRFYTTPAPVTEAPTVATDTFVSSAVEVKAPLVKEGMLGVNDGFAHLVDPGSWVSAWDPLFYTFQGSLELVHTLSGLPWWASALAFAAAIRVMVFPLQIKQNKLAAVTQRIQPELEAIRLKYMYAPAHGANAGNKTDRFAHAAKMSEESRAIMKKHNISPFSAFKFVLPQAFGMIGSFLVIRSISNDPTAYLNALWTDGGALWFQNLTAADPTFVLPVLSTITTASIVTLTPIPNFSRRNVIIGAGALACMSLAFTYAFPAMIHLFWTGSSVFTAASITLLKVPAVKQFFGIPSSDPKVSDAPAPQLYDAPPQNRPKVERVAVPPATTTTSAAPETSSAPTLLNNKPSNKKKTKQ